MKKTSYAVTALFLVLVLNMPHILSAENFRVHTVVPVVFTELHEKISARAGINDALAIVPPDDLTYVSGIELRLKVPESVAVWRDSVAYFIYDNIKPPPSEKKVDYSGDRIFISTIPEKLSLNIYFPLSDEPPVKDSPYLVRISPMPSHTHDGNGRSTIFFRFMLAMKGVPESLENAVFEISAHLVLKDKGMLELTALPEQTEEKKYSVYIDDTSVQDYGATILPTGEHHLSIVSDSYRNELRTFIIEQARTTKIHVNLRGIEPLVQIICPENATVFLDDKHISDIRQQFAVTQGEHRIRFVVGDYEITKSITAVNGRSYTVNLAIDAVVTEEE